MVKPFFLRINLIKEARHNTCIAIIRGRIYATRLDFVFVLGMVLIVIEWRCRVIVEAIHCGQFFPATWQAQGNNKSTFSFFLSPLLHVLSLFFKIPSSNWKHLTSCMLHLPCSADMYNFWGRLVPEAGPAKRFLIGAKSHWASAGTARWKLFGRLQSAIVLFSWAIQTALLNLF